MRRARRALLTGIGLALALPASAAATTYTVNRTADSNGGSLATTCGATPPICSLRDAINYSVSGDKVVVPPSSTPYALSLGILTVSHNLTLTGGGAATTSIQQTGANTAVFSIGSGFNVAMSNLTVTGGKLTGANASGAGITTAGNLVLTGVSVTGNQIQASGAGVPLGAGIYMTGGNLTLRSSQVSGNQVSTPAGSIPQGGGIAIAGGGFASISNSQISNNTVSTGDGSIPEGGGILYSSNGTLAISNSQISGNSLTDGTGSQPQGGGIANEGSGVVTIDQSSITSNRASTGTGSIPVGGGLYGGNFTVSASTITGNSATAGSGLAVGGGLDVFNSTLSGTTVSGNTADGADDHAQGGGISMSGNMMVINSTIVANTVTTTGAGTSQGGGIYSSSTSSNPAVVLNSTLDGNSAPGGTGGSQGGNIFVNGGVTLENTIASGGSATTGPNCAGTTLSSQGDNLESGTDCGFSASGDHQSTDPQLGPLQDNGGPTQTQAVQPGSPIIDAGNTADCPATDQRGVIRPQGSACDIGALEVESPQLTTDPASAISQTAATLDATVTPDTLKAAPATYRFEWGTTVAYGNSTTSMSTTTGSGPNPVSAGLTGLSPHTTYHFRIDATNADGGSAVGDDRTFTTSANPLPPPTKPQLSNLAETHRVFAVAGSTTPVGGTTAAKRHARGTVFSFVLNVSATVTVKLRAQTPGRQVGTSCRPATPRLHSRPRCTRLVTAGSLVRVAHDGVNRLPFTGRLPGRTLAPGRYQAVFTARSLVGPSGPQTIGFTIVKR